jgi:hypothetical protein
LRLSSRAYDYGQLMQLWRPTRTLLEQIGRASERRAEQQRRRET